jgi:hypothetical protein
MEAKMIETLVECAAKMLKAPRPASNFVKHYSLRRDGKAKSKKQFQFYFDGRFVQTLNRGDFPQSC